MVKNIIYLLLLSTLSCASQSTDSLVLQKNNTVESNSDYEKYKGTLGPSLTNITELGPSIKNGSILVILNNMLLSRKSAFLIFQRKRDFFIKAKYYSSDETFKKWGLKTSKGLIVLKQRKQIVDLRQELDTI